MKNFKKALFTLGMVGFLSSSAAFAADRGSNRSVVNINAVSIPSGFDNNEPIAVISGLFPNSCYSWDKAEVKGVDKMTTEIRSYANIRQGMCLMVIIPFSEEVNLGKLEAGEHTLRFVNGDGTYLEKKLIVE
jgi:hypothetical protein